MELKIEMERMLCAKPEKGWYLFKANYEQNDTCCTIICKGSMGWEPREMETVILNGEYVVYKGERQFQFSSAKITLPLEPRAQLHYAAERAKGIGPAMEQKIWDLKKENWRDLNDGEIKGLSATVLESFRNQVRLFDEDKEKAEVLAFLENKMCSPAMASAAWAKWKESAPGMCTANCYELANLPGFSFRTVDGEIRKAFGVGDEDSRRIRAAVLYAMEKAEEDGSTVTGCQEHFDAVRALIPAADQRLIVEQVRKMAEEGKIVFFEASARMALQADYEAEKLILDYAAKADPEQASIPEHFAETVSKGEKFTPDESQIAAVIHGCRRIFAIINGGAGVGKTTVIKMIVRGLKILYPGLSVSLCAPTGKAAARLKEASGINACTIHSLIGMTPEGMFSVEKMTGNIVICDESSMIDSALMAALIRKEPARLILVGDQAQLMPVGKGQPFHDLIALYPEMVRTLTKCYRQTEAVFQAATAIRNGNIPPREARSQAELWKVVSIREPQEAHALICRMAEEGLLDFNTDIVLAPKNGKRTEGAGFPPATVNALNEDLRHIDREDRGGDSGKKFQIGDRVINTENYAGAQVWNGTTGSVKSIDQDGQIWVHLDCPVTDDDGKLKEEVLFDRDMKGSLVPAYALTVHKSQGSQYRKVIIAALDRDRFMLDRQMLYTGVTRTRSECSVIGSMDTLIAGIGRLRMKRTVIQTMKGC